MDEGSKSEDFFNGLPVTFSRARDGVKVELTMGLLPGGERYEFKLEVYGGVNGSTWRASARGGFQYYPDQFPTAGLFDVLLGHTKVLAESARYQDEAESRAVRGRAAECVRQLKIDLRGEFKAGEIDFEAGLFPERR